MKLAESEEKYGIWDYYIDKDIVIPVVQILFSKLKKLFYIDNSEEDKEVGWKEVNNGYYIFKITDDWWYEIITGKNLDEPCKSFLGTDVDLYVVTQNSKDRVDRICLKQNVKFSIVITKVINNVLNNYMVRQLEEADPLK